jgi:hypothetical protein
MINAKTAVTKTDIAIINNIGSPPLTLKALDDFIIAHNRRIINMCQTTQYGNLMTTYSFSITFNTTCVECFAAIGKNSSKLIEDSFPAISESARITTKGTSN